MVTDPTHSLANVNQNIFQIFLSDTTLALWCLVMLRSPPRDEDKNVFTCHENNGNVGWGWGCGGVAAPLLSSKASSESWGKKQNVSARLSLAEPADLKPGRKNREKTACLDWMDRKVVPQLKNRSPNGTPPSAAVCQLA